MAGVTKTASENHFLEAGNTTDPTIPKLNNGSVDSNGEPGAAAVPSFLKPRAYQEEMLAESLKQNIIIAMDTGSGKTQIAVLRIREELGRCSHKKLVWFIAPTVALAEQQHAVLSLQLPAFQSKILSGADNVERWTTQPIWDAILHNIRIVVSTPQVLLDALSNGFLQLTRVALIVFDEAHHCVASAPANRIMQNFYHPMLAAGRDKEVPSIMGLTASPVTKGNVGGLEKIESNLNAICKTPKIHREEMMQFVHTPELKTITFQDSKWVYSSIMKGLKNVQFELDISEDPLIKRLRADKRKNNQEWLLKALETQKTPCHTQLNTFFTRAETIHTELGPWAADTFVAACIERVDALVAAKSQGNVLVEWEQGEKVYISEVLSRIPVRELVRGKTPDVLSDKVELLVKLLAEEQSPGFRGIIFVQQRSTVVMLTRLLSAHPLMGDILPGSFVGDSNYATKKSNIYELTSPNEQKDVIQELRVGTKNLIIATSVLEEGIDVSACNLVVCFDPPSNLRAFIQSRGRARKEASKFVVFVDGDDPEKLSKWEKMEKMMKDVYADDMRKVKEIQDREAVEEEGSRCFRIESTGALLSLDNARQHLDHFCSTLSHSYTETRPEFSMIEDPIGNLLTAKVILPGLIDPSLREATGISSWRTEKMAKRDASFEAYVSLYEAGLVNDHLLPRHCEFKFEAAEQVVEKRANIEQVESSINPWVTIAREWEKGGALSQLSIDISSGDQRLPPIVMVLPIPLVCFTPFKLFWNEETTFTISITQRPTRLSPDIIPSAAKVTHLLLSSMFSSRMPPNRKDFPWLFLPQIELTTESIESWYDAMKGVVPAHDLLEREVDFLSQIGLARTIHKPTRPITIEKCVWMERVDEEYPSTGTNGSELEDDEVIEEYHIEGPMVPKRTDFLHPVVTSGAVSLSHTARQCLPVSVCSVDKLPAMYARFASFIPSIIHKIEVSMVTQKLSETSLAPVGFKDLSLVATAISTSVAREESNYQRIEFLGDSLLKLHSSLQLSAVNPLWPEGLLSQGKDRIVSNTRLSKAAVEKSLDKFILTQVFTGLKWRPPYNSDLLKLGAKGVPKRNLSTKVLADVVEALIGAAEIDGGEAETMRCLKVFIPEVEWMSPDKRIDLLYSRVPEPDERAPLATMAGLEEILGYTFNKQMLLVEALTHPCSKGSAMSYQRLEFVGDSVLDHLVVHEIFNAPQEYAHYDLHLMRTVLVNADFLAFLCLEASFDEARGEVQTKPPQRKGGEPDVTITETTRRRYLWQFMRHAASWEIANAQQVTFKQYESLRDAIHQALDYSDTYPWALLSRLEAGKFFSDIIESLLGAIFIDSRGSMDACRGFLKKIGLMKYVRYVATGKIDKLLHPKQWLGVVAGSSRISYDTRLTAEKEEGKVRRWMCRVLVDDEAIVEVGDGVSRFEVETKAADAALVIMKQARKGDVKVEASDDDDDDRGVGLMAVAV